MNDPQYVPADTVEPGDTIIYLGKEYRVDHINPYDGPFEFVTGIARDTTGWAMSLCKGQNLWVIRNG